MIPRHAGDAQGTPGVQFRRVSARNGRKRTRQEKRNQFTRAGARVSARFKRAAILLPSRSGSRPSSPRALRSEFSDSRGWIPLGLACPFPVSTHRFVKPRARYVKRFKRGVKPELKPFGFQKKVYTKPETFRVSYSKEKFNPFGFQRKLKQKLKP